jgi:hypothetical protein
VDVQKDEILNTLHFDSETGMPQYNPVARKVYINLQDQNIFAVIDPASDQVIGRYPVGKCEGNHGMALDPEHHRAFLSCEGNKLMTVFDLDKHEPIEFLKMPGGPDVIKFEPGLGASMLRVTAAPSPFSIRTTRTTIASSKTSASNTQCTRWPSISKPIVSTRRNWKNMASLSREWWCMRP